MEVGIDGKRRLTVSPGKGRQDGEDGEDDREPGRYSGKTRQNCYNTNVVANKELAIIDASDLRGKRPRHQDSKENPVDGQVV